MSLLPNGDEAIVELAKLIEYALNPKHARGEHTARILAATLGVSVSDANWIRAALLEAARTVNAVRGKFAPYGAHYIVDVQLKGKTGERVTIRSEWLIRWSESTPRLTMCCVY